MKWIVDCTVNVTQFVGLAFSIRYYVLKSSKIEPRIENFKIEKILSPEPEALDSSRLLDT